MPQFRYVVLPKRSCGSQTGQVGRASAERPIAAGHLQDTFRIGNERWEQNDERLNLFISFSIW
jgi:hypothetical protein